MSDKASIKKHKTNKAEKRAQLKKNQNSGNFFICKGCNKPYIYIRLHFAKSRHTFNCEQAYTPEELQNFSIWYDNKKAASNKAALQKHKKNNPKKVAETNKEQYEKNKMDPKKHILRFRHESHGPIFTCISCIRDLFQRSIEELKGDLEHKILNENHMHWCLNFDESLKIRDEVEYSIKNKNGYIEYKTKKLQEGYCLCRTYIGYLKKSQMPPMCYKNSLEPPIIPDCLKDLTNLEKQLIVKNLVFIKVRQLPKTSMAAMNDR